MLRLSHLDFSYQDQIIFQNLNLVFSAPEVIAIIGDNGIGKTTLLRLIAGEISPDDGVIKTQGSISFLHQSPSEPTEQSGGERTLTQLTQVFRDQSRILLLDEPTNNLDHISKAWLIEQLHKYRGLVLVISHDRHFIDDVANKILEISNHSAQIFSGNYSDFSARRAQIVQEQCLIYEQVQRQKKRLTQQIKVANDRAHKSNRRSYNKTVNESKMHYNTQRMGAQNSAGKVLRAAQAKFDQLSTVQKPTERKIYATQLERHFSHSKMLLEITDLRKSYGHKTLFQNLNFTIKTGERIRITGRNGAGKSTLFQIIMGETPSDSGFVKLASGVQVGYISQDRLNQDLNQSFITQHSEIDQTKIYHAASTMDLTPHDISRPAQELSRGQLTKLAILELILNPLDLIILDEITNHLDIRARDNIESALQNYNGAILAATHDEAFAENVGFTQEISL